MWSISFYTSQSKYFCFAKNTDIKSLHVHIFISTKFSEHRTKNKGSKIEEKKKGENKISKRIKPAKI